MAVEINPTGVNYEAWYKKAPDKCDRISDLLPVMIDKANLAPSSHNSQPWKFTPDEEGGSLIVSPDINRRLEVSDPTDRQMYISVGAAIANAKVTARYYGWQVTGEMIQNPDGTTAKKLCFTANYEPMEEDMAFFKSINSRVSSRRAHTQDSISQEVVRFIAGQNDSTNTSTYYIEDKLTELFVGTLMHRADGDVLARPGFRAELSNYIEPNYTARYEGMPAFGFGMEEGIEDLDSIDIQKLILSGMIVQEMARGDLDLLVNRTQAIAFICTREDDPEAWLKAGEKLELIALKATAEGYSVSPLAGLIEVPEVRTELKNGLKTGFHPQVMLRIGKPVSETLHSPRRPSKFTLVNSVTGEVIPMDRPTIFTFEKGVFDLDDLYRQFGPFKVKDRYTRYLADLYSLDNPKADLSRDSERSKRREFVHSSNSQFDGVWVYYPWDDELVHILGPGEFRRLFYSRNNPCILPGEQENLGRLKVVIGGLSVGSNIAVALAKMGIENMAVADLDTVDLSNQSRMAVGEVVDIGERKTDVLSRALYRINPFINLRVYPEGLGSHNLAKVMAWADVYIDHMDNLPLKIEARRIARILRKIVLMATDIDKRPVIDIELPDNPQLFNGRATNEVINELMLPPKSFAEWCKKAVQIFGFENTAAPVLENFVSNALKEQNYGSQLGLTGNVVSGFMAYYLYEIARGNAKKLAPFRIIPIEQENLIDQERLAIARDHYSQVIGN